MQLRSLTLFCCLCTASLAAGGCASRAEIDGLRGEIDALAQADETQRRESAEALELARAARAELAELRATAERAARDAAASRRTLDALDRRMGAELGTGTLK